jgi:hypothetical protein
MSVPLLLHGLERTHAGKNLGVQMQHQSEKSSVILRLIQYVVFDISIN